MKALTFDLGETLVEYEGLPLSWEQYYPTALLRLSNFCGHSPDEAAVTRACDILRRFNTRLHPRIEEVAFEKIVDELADALGCAFRGDVQDAARAFFSVFRQRLRCFPDSLPALKQAKSAGLNVGVFTDVPYGMPTELVEEDMLAAGLGDLIPVLVTSADAGFRKPDGRSLGCLLSRMGVDPASTVYRGNERKDVEVALALGCEAVLLDRSDARPNWGQDRTITSLIEV
jgi:putative hydrolase of the HAD superfamily